MHTHPSSSMGAATEAAVPAAGPVDLVVKLYEGSIGFLEQAIEHARNGDRSRAHMHTVKARNIIAALQNTIDIEAGGELAENLSTFYLLLDRMLLNSSASGSVRGLQQVVEMLSGVQDSWCYVNDTVKRVH